MGTLLRTVIRAGTNSVIRRLGLAKTIAVGAVALVSLWVLTGDAMAADGWTSVIKGADESVTSSAAVQNDDHLFFTTSAGVAYEIEATIVYGSPTTSSPDLRIEFGEDGTIRGLYTGTVYTAGDSLVTVNGLFAQTGTIAVGAATGNRPFTIRGSYIGNGGTFRVLWAQNTNGPNATIVRAGSNLRYRATTAPATDAVAWANLTGTPNFTTLYCDADGTEVDTDCGGGGGSSAWVDITGKPDFPTLYCDADGSEADPDCASADLSAYYTASEVDGIAELASDTCGGPALPPCAFEYASGGGSEEKINLLWWGIWAVVGLLLCLMIAPLFLRLLDPTRGL